ncbi:hypothetical protein QJS04_geneDACA024947 [Acorus gramineus]|uniref:Reverse transcriptase domain-containing protein n=1 Tax=Acorus gramineus TaxID=55184 RepID=A0AAV8ZVK9_ACOGR|nr:hypothetical protein QJS04_geneDACA024947 [Acorus gramineus]
MAPPPVRRRMCLLLRRLLPLQWFSILRLTQVVLTLRHCRVQVLGARRPPPIPTSEKGKSILRGESLRSASDVPPLGYSRPPRHIPVGKKPIQVPIAPQSRSWAQLFPSTEKPTSNNDLEFIVPEIKEDRLVVSCSEEDLKAMDDHWSLSLIGYIIGKDLLLGKDGAINDGDFIIHLAENPSLSLIQWVAFFPSLAPNHARKRGRGTKSPVKQMDIKNFLLSHKPQFVCLVETKLNDNSLKSLKRKLGIYPNSLLGPDARICLLSNADIMDVQLFWPLIKEDLLKAINFFFKRGCSLRLIITKVMALRLQPILKHLISHHQSAFIKGRNIHYNTLLAHELVKYLNQGLQINPSKSQIFASGLSADAFSLALGMVQFSLLVH